MIRRFLADAWSRLVRGEPLDVYPEPVDPAQLLLDAADEEHLRRLVELAEPPAPPRVPCWTYEVAGNPAAVVSSLPLHEDQLEIAREILRAAGSGEPVRSRPRRPSACGCPECADGDPLLDTSFEATLDHVKAIEAVWLDVLAVEVDVLGRSSWQSALLVFSGAGVAREVSRTGLSATGARDPAGFVHR